MLDMGFEPQIRKIVEKMDMPPPGTRQTMLFSATFQDEIQRLASDFLSDYVFLAVGRVGSSTGLIVQRVELVQDMEKRKYLLDLLRAQMSNGTCTKHNALTLVFVETKRGANELEYWLSRNGFPAIAIHGDKVQMEREQALRSFKSGATPILMKDLPLAKSLSELMKEAKQEVPSWLSQYAENTSSSGGDRAKHSVGNFGGYDFRKGIAYGNESNYYSSSYNDNLVAPAIGGYYVAAASSSARTFINSIDFYADPYATSASFSKCPIACPSQ